MTRKSYMVDPQRRRYKNLLCSLREEQIHRKNHTNNHTSPLLFLLVLPVLSIITFCLYIYNNVCACQFIPSFLSPSSHTTDTKRKRKPQNYRTKCAQLTRKPLYHSLIICSSYLVCVLRNSRSSLDSFSLLPKQPIL